MAQRKGRSDYSSVQWYLEWYVATGATATTATVVYTDQNGVAGKTTTVAIAASMLLGRTLQIIPANGDFIRSIESITLAASTGTAGSFGVIATNQRTEISAPVSGTLFVGDWSTLGFAQIYDSSCLMFLSSPGTGGTVGSIGGTITFIQG